MRRIALLVLVLFSSNVLAAVTGSTNVGQLSGGTLSATNGGTGASLQSFINTATSALFVDTALGSDANACTSSGASACKTIQTAINKCGMFFNRSDTVGTFHCVITVAAGTYTENLRAAGLMPFNKASVSLIQVVGVRAIVGGTAASYTCASVSGDPDTGSTTGVGNFQCTATSPGWTAHAFKGAMFEALSGTGAGKVLGIADNTTTAIEFIATGTSNPFDATTTFRIEQPTVFVVGQGMTGGNAGVVQFQDIDFSNGATNSAWLMPATNEAGGGGGALTQFVNVRMNNGSAGSSWSSPFSFAGSYLYGAGGVTASGIAGTSSVGSSLLAGGGTFFFSRDTAAGASRSTLDAGTSMRVQEAFAFSLPLKVHTGDVQVEQNSDLNTGANFSASTGGNLVCIGTTNTGTCLLATFGSMVRLDNVYVHGSSNAIQADSDSHVDILGSLFVDNANTALYATNGGVIRHAGSAATGTTAWTPAALSAASGARIVWTNTPTFTTNTYTIDNGGTTENISLAPALDMSTGTFIGGTTAGKRHVNPTQCTLDGANPSTCTGGTAPAAVPTGSVCWCSLNGITAGIAAGGCDWSVTTTVLSIHGASGASGTVTYGCN